MLFQRERAICLNRRFRSFQVNELQFEYDLRIVAEHGIAEKTFATLMQETREVKVRGDGREEKREQIATISNTDPIARLYLQGYPIKQ